MNTTLTETLSHTLDSLSRHPAVACLIALLMVAAVIDLRTLRIPNWLTVSGMLAGLAFGALSAPGGLDELHGLGWALQGLGLGFAITIPLYVMGVLGAGDVKLAAMTGAFLGPWDALHALLFGFIASGVVMLVVTVAQFAAIAGGHPELVIARERVARLPFAVSAALGTIAWLGARQLGWA